MSVVLVISGPGVAFRQPVLAGQAPLLIGRDVGCDVHLPDPQRKLSRRHLAVWVEHRKLRLRVLSVQSGVLLPDGGCDPGGLGEVPVGGWLQLGPYRLDIEPLETEFGQSTVMPQAGEGEFEDDPFDEWGPGAPAALPAGVDDAQTLPPLHALALGLGIDPGRLSDHDAATWRTIGQTLRIALLGLVALARAADAANRANGGEERTVVAAAPDLNPLRADLPAAALLEYLLEGNAELRRLLPPPQALERIIDDLMLERNARAAATAALVDGLLDEMSPQRLAKRLPLRPGLSRAARLWEAWEREHAEWMGDRAATRERLMARHFSGAFQRAWQAGRRPRR